MKSIECPICEGSGICELLRPGPETDAVVCYLCDGKGIITSNRAIDLVGKYCFELSDVIWSDMTADDLAERLVRRGSVIKPVVDPLGWSDE